MKLTTEQADAIISAIWLVGMGILIVTGWWWPGMALTGLDILVLFLSIALSGLFGASAKPSPFDRKPKPDPSLDDGF